MPARCDRKIIPDKFRDAHLDVSLLRRETVRSCGGLNGRWQATIAQLKLEQKA